MKYLIICITLKLNVPILMLYNGGVRLGLKISTTCNVSKGISLSLFFELSIRASFLIKRGIVTYKRGKLSAKTIFILMTLNREVKRMKQILMKKNLVKIRTNFHVIMLSSSLFQINKYHR